jgi:hypothetical protein
MSQNRTLATWLACIFIFTGLLVGSIIAHDRGADQAIVDHIFHFHVDMEDFQNELEEERTKNELNKEVQREWVRDMQFRDHDVGTVSPPDHNGNRD